MDINMMQNSQMQMNAFTSAFSGYFGDDPTTRFLANFVLVGMLGYLTQNIAVWKDRGWVLLMWLFRSSELDMPHVKLTATETRKPWGDYFESGKRFKAWMMHIKKRITKGQLKALKQLETKGRWGTEEWIPISSGDLWELGDDLVCSFGEEPIEQEGKNPDGIKKTDLFLKVYTTSKERGLQYLLETTKKVVKEFEEEKNNELISGPHIFYYQGKSNAEGEEGQSNGGWEVYPYSSTRKMDHLWFQQKDDFLAAYNNFLENKAIYEERGDPYTFSCLLYGTPGCGKSSLLKAVLTYDWARELKSHLLIIPFSKIETADDLRQLMFSESLGDYKVPYENRIFVFEDFDASKNAKVFGVRERLGLGGVQEKDDSWDAEFKFFSSLFGGDDDEDEKKEEKKDKDGKPTKTTKTTTDEKFNLSDVLNILDGLNERTGQRCFWTTNLEPPEEHFDPAFLRPGRMDMIIQFTKCNHAGLKYLIDQYFESDIDIDDLEGLEEFVHSPAKLKQFCKESSTPDEVIMLLYMGDKHVNAMTPVDMKQLNSGHRVNPPPLFRYATVMERMTQDDMDMDVGMSPPVFKRYRTVG